MALGNDALRARIASTYSEWYGVAVAPERIAVTAGSSAAFVLAFLAMFDAGDAVALPSPGYPCYRHILSALGQRSVLLETGPAREWMPTPDDVVRAVRRDGIKGLLIASPANPTGTMISAARLDELVAVCREHGVRLISDEIYHGLTYERAARDGAGAWRRRRRHQQLLEVLLDDRLARRLDGACPSRSCAVVERLAQNLYISPPAIAQAAALGAFDAGEELEANRRVYAAQPRALARGAAEGRALRRSLLPTGPSTSTATSAMSPATRRRWPGACSRRRASR